MTRPLFTLDDLRPKVQQPTNPFLAQLMGQLNREVSPNLPQLNINDPEEQEQIRLQELFNSQLPSAQEVLDEKKQQESEEALIWQILDLPSKLLGFYSITGFAEGLARGDFEGAVKQFVQGSPFAFVAQGVLDAFGAGVKLTEKKRFSDVSKAMFGEDTGFGRTVVNLMGDILLDPSTWLMPFGSSRKVAQAAHKNVGVLNAQLHDIIRAKVGASGVGTPIAIGNHPDEIMNFAKQVGFVAGESKVGLEKFYFSPQHPGVVLDPAGNGFRAALSLREKVKSGVSSMTLFQVPFYEASATPFKLASMDFELRAAQALDRTGKVLMDLPVLGPIVKRLSPISTFRNPRDKKSAQEMYAFQEQTQRKLLLEGHAVMTTTLQEVPEVMAVPEIAKLATDLMDSDAVDILSKGVIGYKEIAKEANHAGRNALRRELLFGVDDTSAALRNAWNTIQESPRDIKDHDEWLKAAKTLYDSGVPLHDYQLDIANQIDFTRNKAQVAFAGADEPYFVRRLGKELHDQGESFVEWLKTGDNMAEEAGFSRQLPDNMAQMSYDQNLASGPFYNYTGKGDMMLIRSDTVEKQLDLEQLRSQVDPQKLVNLQEELRKGYFQPVRLKLNAEGKIDISQYRDNELARLVVTLDRAKSTGHGVVLLEAGTLPQTRDAVLKAIDGGLVTPRTVSQLINDVAPYQRVKRLEQAEEAIAQANVKRAAEGKAALSVQDVVRVVDTWKKHLEKLSFREMQLGMYDAALEPYFPRSTTPEARVLLDELAPSAIKAYGGDAAFRIYANFTRKRKFSDMSTFEVNLMMGTIGTITGSNLQGHEVLWNAFMKNDQFRKKLQRNAPDAYEFFSVDATSAMFKRISESAKQVSRFEAMDYFFDGRNGITKFTGSTANPEEIRQKMAQAAAEGRPLVAMTRYATGSKGSFGYRPLEEGEITGKVFRRSAREHIRDISSRWYDDIIRRNKDDKTLFQQDFDEIENIIAHAKGDRVYFYEPLKDRVPFGGVATAAEAGVRGSDLPAYAVEFKEDAQRLYNQSHRVKYYNWVKKTFLRPRGAKIDMTDLSAIRNESGFLNPDKVPGSQFAGVRTRTLGNRPDLPQAKMLQEAPLPKFLEDVKVVEERIDELLSYEDFHGVAGGLRLAGFDKIKEEVAAFRTQALDPKTSQIGKSKKHVDQFNKEVVTKVKRWNQRIMDIIEEQQRVAKQVAEETRARVDARVEELGSIKEQLKGMLATNKHNRADLMAALKELKSGAIRAVSNQATPAGAAGQQLAFQFAGPEFGVKFFNDADDIIRARGGPDADLGLKGDDVYLIEKDVAEQMEEYARLTRSPDGMREVLWPLDRFSSLWKAWTVLPFPQSWMRDNISNMVLLKMGGFKSWSAFGDADKFHKSFQEYFQGKFVTQEDAVLAHFGNRKIRISDKEEVAPLQLLDEMVHQGVLNSAFFKEEMQHASTEMLPQSLLSREMRRGAIDAQRKSRTTLPGKAVEAVQYGKIGQWMNWDGVSKENFQLTSPILEFASNVRERSDNFTKVAGYIDARRRGMDPAEAALHLKTHTYTAGARHMSSTEKYALRRILPFYNWVRFSTEMMVKEWATNPKSFTSIGKIHQNMKEMSGIGEIPEDQIVGQYATERLNIPLMMGENGPIYMILDGYIPHADLPALGEAVLGIFGAGSANWSDTFNYFAEKLNPVFKTPLEIALNQSFYFQQDIERFEGEKGDIFGVPVSKRILKAMESLRLLKAIDDLNVINIRDLALGLGDAVARTKGDRAQVDNMFTRWIGGPFGIGPRVRGFDSQSQLNYAAVREKIDASRSKIEIKRRLLDPRPTKQAEIEVLKDNLTKHQANLLRLEDFRSQFKLKNPEDPR